MRKVDGYERKENGRGGCGHVARFNSMCCGSVDATATKATENYHSPFIEDPAERVLGIAGF